MAQKTEAHYYEKQEEGTVRCTLCPHFCVLAPGETGHCRVRKNEAGCLWATSYGKVASYGKDPMEKKPLYHFYPGSKIFSVGSFGCNLDCDFCQNHEISHGTPRYIDTSPENLVNIATNEKNNMGIAYTYNEPTVGIEFVLDVAKALRKAGKKNVLVTNGYINETPAAQLTSWMDGVNIDLKGFEPGFYTGYCGGTVEPVLESIRIFAAATHVEITTLLVPHLNTEEAQIRKIAGFIASINPQIPLHLSRFFPAYKREVPPTDLDTMVRLQEVAKEYLSYVYLGNVPEFNRDTHCPHCNTLWVQRGEEVKIFLTAQNQCPKCGAPSPLRWEGNP